MDSSHPSEYAALPQQESRKHVVITPNLTDVRVTRAKRENDSATSIDAAAAVDLPRQISNGKPLDRFNMVYISLLLSGIGFLLPYNCFVNAVDFYQQRYGGSSIIFDISLTYICIMLVTVFCNNILVTRIPLRHRITFGYMVAVMVLFLTTIFDVILQVFPVQVSYYFTLSAAGIIAMGCTIQQSSFYGYTSMLPRRFTQAVMTGESAAGFIISLNRLATKGLVTDIYSSTAIFFIISTVLLMVCLVIFHFGVKSEFVKYHVTGINQSTLRDDQIEILASGQNGILNAAYESSENRVELLDLAASHRLRLIAEDNNSVLSEEINNDSTLISVIPTARRSSSSPRDELPDLITQESATISASNYAVEARLRFLVASDMWPYMLSIGITYFVTLSLFPGIESEILSCQLHSWTAVLLMAVFNATDLVGKLLGGIPVSWSARFLLIGSSLRILLIPLLLLCAAPRRQPLIRSEFWAVMLTATLGISNGFFGSVPMILAPQRIQKQHKEIAGNLMTLFYSAGLFVGSVFSYCLDGMLGPLMDSKTFCAENFTTTTA